MKHTPFRGIGARLRAVAALVPPGGVVADIGSDHGLLPRHLLASGRVRRCIATERSGGRMAARSRFPAAHPLAESLELRVGDGLEALEPDDRVHTIVLAGMGARTIVRLLGRGDLDRLSPRRLVLQPQTEPERLRRWLVEHDARIVAEKLARESGRFYEAIAARPDAGASAPPDAHPTLSTCDLLVAGPCLIEDRDPLLHALWTEQLRWLEGVARSAGSGPRGNRLRARLAQAQRILDAIEAG